MTEPASTATGAVRIPVDRLYRIGVVVRDARSSARRYAELLGIERWKVTQLDARRIRVAEVRGAAAACEHLVAEGVTPNGSICFSLIEPLSDDSVYAEHLVRCGESIHHIDLAIIDQATRDALLPSLEASGIDTAQRIVCDGAVEQVLLDTGAALAGYQVMLRVPLADAADGVDEVWDFAWDAARPSGAGPLRSAGVQHLGVVVRDVLGAARRHGELLGIPRWRFVKWETRPDRLLDPEYAGAPVHHSYTSGMAFDVANFGFELVQPVEGPSDYREDFLAWRGEGIHHLNLVQFRDDAELEGALAWLDQVGIGVRMQSRLRGGAARFLYLDTRAALGWQLECVVRRPDTTPPPPIADFTLELHG